MNSTSVGIVRIKSIQRDHEVTRLALDRLLDQARRDPTFLTGDLKVRDIVEASDRLDVGRSVRARRQEARKAEDGRADFLGGYRLTLPEP